MWITHSYIGTMRGNMRCLFFLLYEDYIQAQQTLVQGLDRELERFARNLRDRGAIVRPFLGDIDKVRSHILAKNWSEKQRHELNKTPSLLMINVDFDEFNPQEHPWLLIHFGERITEFWKVTIYRVERILSQIAESINDDNIDPFEAARKAYYEIQPTDAMEVFEMKPGIFGFSIDLRRGAEFLRRIWYRHTQR